MLDKHRMPVLLYKHRQAYNASKGGESMSDNKVTSMDRLKGKFTEQRKTYADCAELLGIATSSVNNKLQGRSPFTCWEAAKIVNWLRLSTEDSIEIFLT